MGAIAVPLGGKRPFSLASEDDGLYLAEPHDLLATGFCFKTGKMLVKLDIAPIPVDTLEAIGSLILKFGLQLEH